VPAQAQRSGVGALLQQRLEARFVENHDGDTYRAVYTVRCAEAIYVLHYFQKKSKRGIKTPKKELDLIAVRLKKAQEDYEQWLKAGKP